MSHALPDEMTLPEPACLQGRGPAVPRDAARRVMAFLEQRARGRGIDQEEVSVMNAGSEREPRLLTADLQALTDFVVRERPKAAAMAMNPFDVAKPDALTAVPEQLTPVMAAAAATAREAGADFAGQYQAALAAWCGATATRSGQPSVSPARGEALLEQLEARIASPLAQEMFQCILQSQKEEALAHLKDEGFVGQDAEDLYAYGRWKWAGPRLVLAEIPLAQAESVLRALAPEAKLLVRRGLGVAHAFVDRYAEPLQLVSNGERVPLPHVQQLWLVQPTY